jgi:hypothetical protein
MAQSHDSDMHFTLVSATDRVFSINFLQLNKSLQTLDLNETDIGDAGAAALAEALKVVVVEAQILIFRLETCFLFQLLSFFEPFYRCHKL